MEEMERHHMLIALSTEITKLSGMKAITSNIDEHERIDELIKHAMKQRELGWRRITMKNLLRQYRATQRKIKAALEKLQDIPEFDRTPSDNSDISNLEAMSLDLGFAIRYMEQRKYPDPLHPITRWSTEKREILMEPDKMNRCFGRQYIMPSEIEYHEIDPDITKQINEYLDLLSERERECFLLIYERGFAWREAADMMGIAHGRINNIMHRVRKKFQSHRDKAKPQSAT